MCSAIHLRKSPLRQLDMSSLSRLQSKFEAGPSSTESKLVLPRGRPRAAAADSSDAKSKENASHRRGAGRAGRGQRRKSARGESAAASVAAAEGDVPDGGGGAVDVKHAPALVHSRSDSSASDDDSGAELSDSDSDAELCEWERPPDRRRTRSATGAALRNSVVAALFPRDMVSHADIQLSGDDLEAADFDTDDDSAQSAYAAESDEDAARCDRTPDCVSCFRCCRARIDEAERLSAVAAPAAADNQLK
jgi:hypothetical protein